MSKQICKLEDLGDTFEAGRVLQHILNRVSEGAREFSVPIGNAATMTSDQKTIAEIWAEMGRETGYATELVGEDLIMLKFTRKTIVNEGSAVCVWPS